MNKERYYEYLLGSAEFAEFSSILERLTGLVMALNTPGVTKINSALPARKGNPVCALIRKSPEGLRRCSSCDRWQQGRAAAEGKAKLYTCHAGFIDMAIPIIIEGTHVASISSGQVLPEPPSAEGFEKLQRKLAWLRISEKRLHQAYGKAPYLPKDRVRDVMRLLEIFARQLCESARRISELESRLEREEIRRVKELVEERFRDSSLQLDDAADCAGFSSAHFSHLFRKETGETFTRFVQSRRVAEARRLLSGTEKSVTEICFACGFSNLTHFNRVFRSFEQMSPRAYRSHG